MQNDKMQNKIQRIRTLVTQYAEKL